MHAEVSSEKGMNYLAEEFKILKEWKIRQFQFSNTCWFYQITIQVENKACVLLIKGVTNITAHLTKVVAWETHSLHGNYSGAEHPSYLHFLCSCHSLSHHQWFIWGRYHAHFKLFVTSAEKSVSLLKEAVTRILPNSLSVLPAHRDQGSR